MAEYIEREALMNFPIRQNHYDRENGNEHFIIGIETVLEYAENLPAADVVPRAVIAEIFAEIEKAHRQNIRSVAYSQRAYFDNSKFEKRLAELKKKYTEDKS